MHQTIRPGVSSLCGHCCTVQPELKQPCDEQEQEPRLPLLLKMLLWAHKQLEEKVVYPEIPNLLTGELSVPSS